MLEERKEQDAVLNRIGQLLHDLKTHNTTAAISIFQLPLDTIIEGGTKWEKSGGETPAYFETEEPPYCVGPYELGNSVHHKDHLAGVQYWIRVDDAMSITSGGVLSVLALILLPQEINPKEQKVASRLLDIVLKQKDKNRKPKNGKRDNWSRFLRLRGAWDDQDGARRWVDDQNMLDFNWDDVKNPTRFGVDFGQSMEPDQVRKEQREAKYWWIDIPDLAGLVLKILPTLERQREKELRGSKSLADVGGDKLVIAYVKGSLPENESIKSTAIRLDVSRKTAKKAREEKSGILNNFLTPQRQSIASKRMVGGDALKGISAIDRQEPQGTLEDLKESVVEHAPTMWGWKKAKAKEWLAQFNDKDELGDAIEEEQKKYNRAQGAGTRDEKPL
jgi:hypothetical protein